MCKPGFRTLLLVFGLAVISCGCGEQKAVPAQTVAVPVAVAPATQRQSDKNSAVPAEPMENAPEVAANPEIPKRPEQAALTPTELVPSKTEKPARSKVAANRDKPVQPATETEPIANPKREARPFVEGAFLAEDIVGLFVFHPKQFSETPIGRMLSELGIEEYTYRGSGLQNLPQQLKFADIERLTVVVDPTFIAQFQNQLGMQGGVPFKVGAVAEEMEVEVLDVDVAADHVAPPFAAVEGPGAKHRLRNSLKQIGLAFHNYHDVNSAFPPATGEEAKLSWRVHLLPYLDQAPLYNQFHLDESWDSEHNKTLISQMPEIFKSPGVTDEGKTAIHVFTGEKTLFHGDEGPKILDVTDGTSNTLLAVVAGSDTAETWTKPGGLEVDLADPAKALGELEDDQFFVIFVDGSVRELQTEIDETLLANLIQPADGNVVELNFPAETAPQIAAPILILTLVNDAKPEDLSKAFLSEFSSEKHEDQAIAKNASTAIWFPDAKTAVLGPIESIKQMITKEKSAKEDASPLIDQLQLSADFTMAIDIESQAQIIQMLAEDNPVAGMILNVKSLSAHLSFAGTESESLVAVDIATVEPSMAMTLSAVAKMGVEQVKASALQMPQAPNQNANDEELQGIVKRLISSATVELDGDQIQLRIPTPQGFDRLPELLKPALESAITAAKDSQFKNSLKQIGLAFHNFHDTYGTFPGAGRIHADQPVGLSWRVYLLPYLDQATLYNQFKLDESWDSEHNKVLVEKMPEIFRSPGVEDPSKTAFHVFVGPGSPFAKDATPKLADFADGTSNTIVAILGGPDTAEVWTKPGGLDFDPEDPVKTLGKLIRENFLAMFADGSVRSLDKNIDPTTLRRLIQHQDGEPLQ